MEHDVSKNEFSCLLLLLHADQQVLVACATIQVGGELISLECRVAHVYSTTKLEGDLEIPSKVSSGQTFREQYRLVYIYVWTAYM